MIWQNLPNLLTFFRIGVIPIIVTILLIDPDDNFYRIISFLLFTLCGISDFLDGWIARRWNIQSEIGRILDPIADKIFIVVMMMLLIHTRDIQGILMLPALLIVSREIFISGLREYFAASNKIPVSFLAKWKTVCQLLALGSFIIEGTLGLSFVGAVMLWISMGITVYTAYEYTRYRL